MDRFDAQSLVTKLESAWQARASLRVQLSQNDVDCFRILQGSTEGLSGVTCDAYGPLLFLQLRENADLEISQWDFLEEWATAKGFAHWMVSVRQDHQSRCVAGSPLPDQIMVREFGLEYPLKFARMRLDPPLFLDTRCLRRYLSQLQGLGAVANLFCFTNSLGLVAELRGGAHSVVAVDFSKSNLINAERLCQHNGAQRQNYICEEAYPILWQWAGRGLPQLKGRRAPQKVDCCRFDTVIVDPPQRSKGRFGTVDIKQDYPSLIRPCCEIIKPGGHLIATNNLASTSWTEFEAMLKRSATKSCRTVGRLERIWPDADFPSNDGQPPLKVAVVQLT